MKVKKLMKLLERCNPEAEVEAYDPSSTEGFEYLHEFAHEPGLAPVTGIAYSDAYVTLWTDEL